MSQSHTVIPWLANLAQFPYSLNHHLQGLISHGDVFVIYRTFHNVRKDSNLAIHCLLLQLERRMEENNGKLPDTIFIQIDGGPENANVAFLALCELLVVKRLTKRIFLTRLPVGHTHEDIDSKFGLLWYFIRCITILVPQVILFSILQL